MPATSFEQQLQRALTEVITSTRVPGAQAAVIHGSELHETASGVLNTRTGVTATTDSLFQIGSLTKIWTAVLTLQLVDEGIIALDDPISTHLPELVLADPAATSQIRIRDLLQHRGGFDGDYFTDTGRGLDAVAKLVADLKTSPQFFPPGQQFAYSNAGWVVLGRLIEVIRGTDYLTVVRQRLYEPLQLEHAVTLPEEAILHRAAAGHALDADGTPTVMPSWQLPMSTAPTGAALTMSAGNLARFGQLLLRGGTTDAGTSILSPELTALIGREDFALPVPGFMGDGFGMGAFTFHYDGAVGYGHDGQTVGQTACLRVLPEQGLVIVILTNRDNTIQVMEAIQAVTLEAFTDVRLVPTPEPPEPPLPVDEQLISGFYANHALTATVEVADGRASIRLGSPSLELGHQPAMPLSRLADTTYVVASKGQGPALPFQFVDTDGDGVADFLSFMRMLRRSDPPAVRA